MKKINYLLFLLFLSSLGIVGVKAASCDDANFQCITCTYPISPYNIIFTVKANGSGGAEVTPDQEKTGNDNGTYYFKNESITEANFIVNKEKLACPDVLYYKKFQAGYSMPDITITMSFKKGNLPSESSKSASTDNNKPFKDSVKQPNPDKHKCTDYSIDTCPTEDDYGAECEKVQNKCEYKTITKHKCPEYSIGSCPTKDDYGKECKRGENRCEYKNPEDAYAGNVDIGDFCEQVGVKRAFRFVGILLYVVKVVIPALLIIFGTIDFGKALVSSKDDEIKKSAISLITRFIIAVIIFVLPTIVTFIFKALTHYDIKNNNSNKDCITCIFTPKNCNISKN